MNPRVLVIGIDGLIGAALRTRWQKRGLEVFGTSRRKCDSSEGVMRFDLSTPPYSWDSFPVCEVAVLCAAVTALGKCRDDPIGTRKINVEHTFALATQLARQGTFVVFLSSNLVFDGSKAHQGKDDRLCPMTEYGRQKAELELRLVSSGIPHAVVRLTKVFHPNLKLLLQWHGCLGRGEPIEPYADMVCAPLLLDVAISGIEAIAEQKGVGCWQLSPSSDLSYARIGLELARITRMDRDLVRPRLASECDSFEHIAEHTTLNSSRAVVELGLVIPKSEDAVERTLATISPLSNTGSLG